jgi:hypothetical protein
MEASRQRTQVEFVAVRGGWMAKSVPSSRVGIAVIAPSQEQAEADFEREFEAWAKLLDAYDKLCVTR